MAAIPYPVEDVVQGHVRRLARQHVAVAKEIERLAATDATTRFPFHRRTFADRDRSTSENLKVKVVCSMLLPRFAGVYGAEQQANVGRIPVAIEEQGRQCQPSRRKGMIDTRQPEKTQQDHWQESEDESVGVEEHLMIPEVFGQSGHFLNIGRMGL